MSIRDLFTAIDVGDAGARVARCAIDVATSRERGVLLKAFQGSVLELCQSQPGRARRGMP